MSQRTKKKQKNKGKSRSRRRRRRINMEDTTRSGRVANHDVYSPCYFLREAVSAILKCLGFESKPNVDDNISNISSSCSKEKDKKNKFIKDSGCTQDDHSSHTSPDGKPSPSDPTPSTIMDPANDPRMEELARRGRTPARPGISTGRDPQTNTSSSDNFH